MDQKSEWTKDQENQWPCIKHYITETTLTDYMYQEKREEEDLPASKTALMHRYNDSRNTYEGGQIIAIRNNTGNTINNRMTITRKQEWKEKQLYGRFKRLINNILHEKTWTWLRKGNFKRETEFLQIVAQSNAIKTNHIKVRIDNTQQNSKCRSCETIHHIIIVIGALVQ